MKKVKAYKCGFCKKIYENKSSCKSHEYRCYFNPRTRSCAGCGFSFRTDVELVKANYFTFTACLLNHKIIKKLKTNCSDFIDKHDMDSILQSEQAKHEVFNREDTKQDAIEYFKNIQ